MANNITMPRFGRASGIDNWTEADTFDVDMLAECLLEDGNTYNSMAFDFGLHLPSSTLVSTENSEDGQHPAVAQVHSLNVNPAPFCMMPPQISSSMHGLPQLAPAPVTKHSQINLQSQIQDLGMVGMLNNMPANHPGQGLIFHDHSLPDNKRQRIDPPVSNHSQITQVQPIAQAPGMTSVQQLALAAMQQGKGRKKSQAQIDRRRERNRILARRTRLRKKFFFESLQKEVMDLQRENMRLKAVVRGEIASEEGQKILDECDAAERMPPSVLEACNEGFNEYDMQDYHLVQAIQSSQHSFIITDPCLPDNPIVFASDDFLQLTGYSREQVLGRNCRFLQGTDTSLESVQKIRKAIAVGEDVSVTLINYMADGTPFWNRLFIAALSDAQNNIVNFIGVVVKVSGPEPEDEDDVELAERKESDSTKSATAENIAFDDPFTAAAAAATQQ